MDKEKEFEQWKNLVPRVYNKKFGNMRWLEEDLLQEGYIGLWKAIESYREEGCHKEIWYYRNIEYGMKNYIAKQGLLYVVILA